MRATLALAATLFLAMPSGSQGAGSALVEACVGPGGDLRLAGDGCHASERPFAWQRGGGVWVHDALGRPLGRSLDRDLFWMRVDATGLRVAMSPHSGLPLPLGSIRFSERDCQGIAVGSLGRAAGDVVGHGLRDRLIVATDRVLPSVTVQSEVLFGISCRNLSAPETMATVRELALLEPHAIGFELPVPLPMRFGTGPLGEIDEEIVEACVGPRGRLRIPDAGAGCRPAEQTLSWQRLGGLRVYDGLGRDVGAPIGTIANTTGLGILLPASGAWIEPVPLTGTLGPPPARFFAEAGCQGESVIAEDFRRQSSGRVFADATPGEFVIATDEIVEMEVRSVRFQVECRAQFGPVSGHRAARYDGPLPELPLPIPLVVGFPGSPVADPDGPEIALGFVDACAGPAGQLRVIEEGTPCRPSEHALRWPRRGGFRALDASGRELGAFLENPDPQSGVSGDAMRIIDDASGLLFAVEAASGELGKDFVGVVSEVSFTAPFCSGTPFLLSDSRVGFVFPFLGQLWVGRRLEPLGEASFHDFVGCAPRSLFSEPRLSTRLAPFTGVVPFPLPVETPLLLGPGN